MVCANIHFVWMKNLLYYILIANLTYFSCIRQQKENKQFTFAPKTIEARGYDIPRDSLTNPKRVFANKPKTILAGKPTIIYTNTNVKPVGKPKVFLAGKPKVFTPGQGALFIPQILTAIDHPLLIGIPEVVIAKDAHVKDRNPNNFSSFNKQQGLKHDVVRCISQDKSGNLWFGTSGGASKYDGRSFTHFTEKEGLNFNYIFSMLVDKDGNIWFGSKGVTKYDGKFFTNFTEKEGFSNNEVHTILQDKNGDIWFGTMGDGVTKYDGKNFTHYTKKEGLSNDSVLIIYQDKTGMLWFGTDGGGVSKFDGISFTHVTQRDGLSNNIIRSILQSKNGDIWFGTNGGVCKYNGKSFTHYTEKEGLSGNIVTSILQDKSGNLWFGTDGGGVTKYDGQFFTQYTKTEGLSNNSVLSIFQDNSRNIWLGTYSGGVSKYNGNLFTFLTENEGLSSNSILSILRENDSIMWFGCDGGGVSKYNGKSFTHFTEKEGLINNSVWSIAKDKNGNIWFGTKNGVSKYNGKSFTNFTKNEGLINNFVYSMLGDKDGNVWFGTDGGVTKYDGESFTLFTEKEGFGNDGVRSIFQDKSGTLWFGTAGGGVYKYDGKSFTRFTKTEGLSNNYVYSIFQDKSGILWFGTAGGGVVKYDGQFFTHFTEREGLSNNYVFSILQDKSGSLWFGTRFGLNKLISKSFTKFSAKHNDVIIKNSDQDNNQQPILFKNYTYENGFLGIGCIQGAICEDSNGVIWIATNEKLTVFHPEEDEIDTIPPNIQLAEVELFNENIPWANLEQRKDTSIILGNGVTVGGFHFEGTSKWYGLPNNLNLKYNNNFLTFRYIGITQHQSKKVKYQYKLEGLDENWSAPTLLNEASYGNLPHGFYTFSVKAMNSDGYWSNQYSYTFTIRPPWWKTLWFKFLMGILIVSSLFGFYRWRVATLRRQKIELKRIVKEKTKEVVLQKEELETVNEELTATNNELYYQREEILKQSELLQQQNEKLIEMDRFKQAMTSMIVHDLKNPLNLILNISKSLRPEKQIATMKQSGKQMLNMVLNILDVHKYEEVKMNLELEDKQLALIAINAINQVQFLYEQKDITVKNEIEFGLITKVEAETIERVFINLLTNAIKYTPTGGIIVLSSNQHTDKMVRIGVTDTGEGIAEDGMHLVFQKFGQIIAKQSGTIKSTGLGLTFCKMAVEAHGGEIGLNSEVGKGTTFWFTLQLGSADHVKLQAVENNEVEEIETIIFTEEERKILESIIVKLKRFTVYETDDIEEILTELSECKSGNIQRWISQLTKNLATLNQSRFLELLNI